MFDERTDSCTHLLRQILANDLRQMQKIAKYQLPQTEVGLSDYMQQQQSIRTHTRSHGTHYS